MRCSDWTGRTVSRVDEPQQKLPFLKRQHNFMRRVKKKKLCSPIKNESHITQILVFNIPFSLYCFKRDTIIPADTLVGPFQKFLIALQEVFGVRLIHLVLF